jgi:hypothetical protein
VESLKTYPFRVGDIYDYQLLKFHNMPIDYSKYPSNWKSEIRPRILERANNCCENCYIRDKEVYITQDDGLRRILNKYGDSNFYVCPDGNKRLIGKTGNWHLKKVVLTIAHLDNNIENNSHDNLKALCQKCHLAYDKEYHMKNARNTNNKKKGLVSFFDLA